MGYRFYCPTDMNLRRKTDKKNAEMAALNGCHFRLTEFGLKNRFEVRLLVDYSTGPIFAMLPKRSLFFPGQSSNLVLWRGRKRSCTQIPETCIGDFYLLQNPLFDSVYYCSKNSAINETPDHLRHFSCILRRLTDNLLKMEKSSI